MTELDLRPGGRSRYVMRGPDGATYPVTGVCREVVPMERIVTTDEFDEGFAAPEGMELPTGIVLTVLFEDLGPRTRLTLRILHPTPESRPQHEEMGVVAGWNSSFECLDEHLAQLLAMPGREREIVITRLLNAPRDRVFAAWSDPAVLNLWWGPRGFTTTTHEMDFRSGGIWRFIMHGPDGVDYPNLVRYEEIIPHERIRYIHSGEGENDDIHFRSEATFADRGPQTELTLRLVFDSAAEREHVVRHFGAIEGGFQTLERLAELVAQGKLLASDA